MLVVSFIKKTSGEIDFLIFHTAVMEVRIGASLRCVQESSSTLVGKTIRSEFRQRSIMFLNCRRTKMAGVVLSY